MTYLNHDQILDLCERGSMVDWDKECINTASLDVRLGNILYVEEGGGVLDYRERQRPVMKQVEVDPEHGYVVSPGQFFLAHTIEKCNFPDDLAALFRIKSSMGRIGLEHMDAGWVDPGFNGSLTLEFKFMLNSHSVRLRPGDRIGQLIFFRGNKVSEDKSYRTVGNYNGSDSVVHVGYK
jgi:dCTP deaminase